MLYRMGRALAQCAARALAVVGSRNPTPQGLQNARALRARRSREAGVTVVSGLALGIDGAAHEGALEGAAPGQRRDDRGGRHRAGPRLSRASTWSSRTASPSAACCVSEYPLGTPPLRGELPARNRIIAGLAQGTLVVEAALQSGSLITARLAAEQGKEVFAIPGSIHSPQARGCHALLRQGAKLVETRAGRAGGPAARRCPRAAAAARARARDRAEASDPLLQALGYDPVGLDALIARTGMPAPQLQAQLLELELAGRVARLPGGLFQRIATRLNAQCGVDAPRNIPSKASRARASSGLYWASCLKCWCSSTKTTGAAMHAPSCTSSNASSAPMASNPRRSTQALVWLDGLNVAAQNIDAARGTPRPSGRRSRATQHARVLGGRTGPPGRRMPGLHQLPRKRRRAAAGPARDRASIARWPRPATRCRSTR